MSLLTSAGSRVRRAAVTPTLVAFVASSAARRHPYRTYGWWRSVDPIHASPFGIWVLTRHADVVAALRHPALGSDETKADSQALKFGLLSKILSRDERNGRRGPFNELFSRLMLFQDPPDHTRLRGLVSKAFTPRRAEALAARVADLVDEFLDGVAHRHELELMSELAYPLPAPVICELIGVPHEDEELIVAQAPALATGPDPGPMRTAPAIAAADNATRVLAEYLDRLIATRRRHPGADLLSALIAAEEQGDKLSHDELVGTALLLLFAGHETTANLIGNGLLALLRHPDQLDRLRRDPGLDRSAIEELLRYESPVQMVERITLDHVTIGDVTIPPGRILVLCTGAANRDPAIFENPDKLDLARSPNPHVALAAAPTSASVRPSRDSRHASRSPHSCVASRGYARTLGLLVGGQASQFAGSENCGSPGNELPRTSAPNADDPLWSCPGLGEHHSVHEAGALPDAANTQNGCRQRALGSTPDRGLLRLPPVPWGVGWSGSTGVRPEPLPVDLLVATNPDGCAVLFVVHAVGLVERGG